MHTPRHIRKNSGFSTQDEHMVLLGLEALTEALYLRYATCSTYQGEVRGWQRFTYESPTPVGRRIQQGTADVLLHTVELNDHQLKAGGFKSFRRT